MNKIPILLLLLAMPSVGFAYNDPTSSPPLGNTAPPLNIGSQSQSKAGDLEVENFKATGGITLDGVFKDSWVGAGSTCGWEGTKCSCAWDDSSIGFVTVTLGVTCSGGMVTDFGMKSFNFSSREATCPAAPPAGCDSSYNVTGIDHPPSNAVMRTLEAAVAVFDNYVVRTIRGIGKLLRRWF